MSKKKKSEERICCIAYLSTEGDIWSADKREQRQLNYIREYAKAHNVKIVKVMHRDVLGQTEVNHHFNVMVELIKNKKADGIILANMMCVSTGVADAYYKIGKVKAAGGHIVTVDEGRLGMNVKAVTV